MGFFIFLLYIIASAKRSAGATRKQEQDVRGEGGAGACRESEGKGGSRTSCGVAKGRKVVAGDVWMQAPE